MPARSRWSKTLGLLLAVIVTLLLGGCDLGPPKLPDNLPRRPR